MTPTTAHSEPPIERPVLASFPDWPAQRTVESVSVAAVLADPPSVVFLRAFMTPAGMTIGQAASQFALSPNRAYRRVQRLVRLGLLTVVGVTPRAGKAVRRYRCAARSWFIPVSLYPLGEWLRTGFQAQFDVFNPQLEQALGAAPHPVGGLLVGDTERGYTISYATPDGQLWDPAHRAAPAFYSGFRPLQLDHHAARAFQTELAALVDRYAAAGGNTTYLLGTFLTPVVDAGGRDAGSQLRVE
jgi:Helix-turn-helix domain